MSVSISPTVPELITGHKDGKMLSSTRVPDGFLCRYAAPRAVHVACYMLHMSITIVTDVFLLLLLENRTAQ